MQTPPYHYPPQVPAPTPWNAGPQLAPQKKRSPALMIGCIAVVALFGSCAAAAVITLSGPVKKRPGVVDVKGKLPEEKRDYAGSWLAPNFSLTIGEDGTIDYEKRKGSSSTSLHGVKIDHFEHDDFVVGSIFSTKFVVSQPPIKQGDEWKMTVDGVELTKADARADSTASVDCSGGKTGFECTAKHTGGVYGVKVCWDVELSCEGAETVSASACEDVDVGAQKKHSYGPSDLSLSGCRGPTKAAVKNIKLTASKK